MILLSNITAKILSLLLLLLLLLLLSLLQLLFNNLGKLFNYCCCILMPKRIYKMFQFHCMWEICLLTPLRKACGLCLRTMVQP